MSRDHDVRPNALLAGAAWLVEPRPTRAVLGALEAAGYGARVVGGAVRNTLLGKPVSDIDIATTALPEDVMRVAVAAGFAVAPTGLKHGTVTVMRDRCPFEVTTLRRDVETDGRHATVAFTDDWAADASRRDFTINALYCDAGGRLYDPLGGMADLAARRVRFIGDQVARVREDYLRILRFFRFSAEYTVGAPDASGLAACVAERGGLDDLSAERVRTELLKLLAAPRAGAVLAVMFEHGLLAPVLGRVPRLAVFDRLVAIESAIGLPPDAVRRLGALAVLTGDDAAALADRLRLSGEEARGLAGTIAGARAISPALDPRALRGELYRVGDAAFRSAVLLGWARGEAAADNGAWLAVATFADAHPARAFPLSGRDLLALGLPPGPRVGVLLRAAEAWWVENDFPGRDRLDAFVRALIEPRK